MRVLVVAATVCAGCFNPAPRVGTACETVCPGNLICMDHVCREPGYDAGVIVSDAPEVDASTIDGPPGDVDNDTIPNNLDNCPNKANLDQHDEDADVIGDVCDPCPHLAGNATDGDADGVGDDCDPQPSVGKQRIKFFDPLTADLAPWSHFSNVTRVGETLRINGLGGDTGSRLAIANGETRIWAAGTITSVSTTGPRQVALSFGIVGTGAVYHYGEFYDSGPGSGEVAVTKANNGDYTSMDTDAFAGVIPTGAWSMRIDGSVAAQQMAMVARLGGVDYTLMASTAASPPLAASPTIELYIQHLDVSFDYFLVIETLP